MSAQQTFDASEIRLAPLPIISGLNLCCCLWVVSGGLVAAYVFQQSHPEPISAGDGALVGLLAGIFGAIIYTVVSIPIDLVVGPIQREMLRRVLDMTGNMPPDMRDMFNRFSGDRQMAGAFFLVGHIIGFVFWTCVGAVFSTLGGLLGSAIFKKQTPPGTIDIPSAS